MNKSLATFMGIAATVIVISALVFYVAYDMVDKEVTGTGGYKTTIEGVTVPTTSAPRTTR
ncbi:hypothetical protein ACFYKX_25480 [Cytobacillus sp. FJAT-54145]|uniref:Uncharacterized protein n=1 Tax=Cytobacillus spartinae TaxID=3299023 RepID=A0ABW6KM17_9BACI